MFIMYSKKTSHDYFRNSIDRFGDDLYCEILSHFDDNIKIKYRSASRQWYRCSIGVMRTVAIRRIVSPLMRVALLHPQFYSNVTKLYLVSDVNCDLRHEIIYSLSKLKTLIFIGDRIRHVSLKFDTLPENVKEVKFYCYFHCYCDDEFEEFIKCFAAKTTVLKLYSVRQFQYNTNSINAFSEELSKFVNLKNLTLTNLDMFYTENYYYLMAKLPKLKCLKLDQLNSTTIEVVFKGMSAFATLSKLTINSLYSYWSMYPYIKFSDNLILNYYNKVAEEKFDDELENQMHTEYYAYDRQYKTTVISINPLNHTTMYVNPKTKVLVFNYNFTNHHEKTFGRSIINHMLKSSDLQHIRTREELMTDTTLQLFLNKAKENPNQQYSLSTFNAKIKYMLETNFTVYLKDKTVHTCNATNCDSIHLMYSIDF